MLAAAASASTSAFTRRAVCCSVAAAELASPSALDARWRCFPTAGSVAEARVDARGLGMSRRTDEPSATQVEDLWHEKSFGTNRYYESYKKVVHEGVRARAQSI